MMLPFPGQPQQEPSQSSGVDARQHRRRSTRPRSSAVAWRPGQGEHGHVAVEGGIVHAAHTRQGRIARTEFDARALNLRGPIPGYTRAARAGDIDMTSRARSIEQGGCPCESTSPHRGDVPVWWWRSRARSPGAGRRRGRARRRPGAGHRPLRARRLHPRLRRRRDGHAKASSASPCRCRTAARTSPSRPSTSAHGEIVKIVRRQTGQQELLRDAGHLRRCRADGARARQSIVRRPPTYALSDPWTRTHSRAAGRRPSAGPRTSSRVAPPPQGRRSARSSACTTSWTTSAPTSSAPTSAPTLSGP
jgi:hypothetical protein